MSNLRQNMDGASPDPADEAGYWDALLRAPDCSDADRALFARWRDASPENRDAFERLQAIVASLRVNMVRADVRAVRDAALRVRPPVWRRPLFAAAAAVTALAVATTISLALPDFAGRAALDEISAMTARLFGSERADIYETGIGQRSTVTLQDGSSVELNAKSRIRVTFTATARNVELTGGQALFHVAKNPHRPFIVRAADRDITAVGTAFDVRLDPASLRVTLLEGKVRVTAESDRDEVPAHAVTSTIAVGSEIYLTPGQQLVTRLSDANEGASGASAHIPVEQTAVRAIDVGRVTGWRDGRIFLDDLTLGEAVAEMNRYSLVQISVSDARLAGLRVNGMFRAGEQEGFVSALRQYYPIAVRHDSDTRIVLTRRE